MASNLFSSLKISEPLLRVTKDLKFSQMTPIQAASIPVLLSGQDFIGQSKTGSGKTAAFVIPILQRIKISEAQPQALILCPTRELCDQVLKEVQKISRYLQGLRSVALVGGQPYQPQEEALRKGSHLIVGTPGRTLEHLKNGKVNITKLKVLVLDEADRLLEEGFAEELTAILEQLPPQRQTVFFSATFPTTMEELSQKYQKNAKRVTITEAASTTPMIQQYLYRAEKPQKLEALTKILKLHPSPCTLIFCRTKALVDEIGKMLLQQKIPSLTLHADLKQTDRGRATAQFRKGQIQVLVATDVAARGLDIERLELVINVDLPASPEIYLHRIGRTGRAGRKGTAVSIATEYEATLVKEIEAFTGVEMQSSTFSFSVSAT